MSLLKISEAAALGLHTISIIARHKPRRFSNEEIATELKCSMNTLSKVLQRMVKAGIITSVRGPGGGFELARQPAEITVLDVYEAIDGKLDSSCCVLGNRYCDNKDCLLGGIVHKVQDLVTDSFASTNIEKLAASMKLGDKTYGKA